jgi:hypothetical protein
MNRKVLLNIVLQPLRFFYLSLWFMVTSTRFIYILVFVYYLRLSVTENCNFEGNLSFTEISDDFVEKQINKINVNKATGFDGDYFSCVMAQPVLLLDCQETLHY